MGEDFPVHLAGFRAGSLVAGYSLEAQVGKGGMAVVFRARDERLDRLVALKILAPELTADQAFRRRFIAESRAAAAVDDPHILPVYEAGEADGVLFIAMRFVQGGDLRRVLEREGALPPDRAAAFISPVASALDAAHGAGLVHRDVKPANILVDARPRRPDHVYLSDFGVSKRATASVRTVTGQYMGTVYYSAPEQIQGRVVDGRADQYALGCVAYQLLTGQVPFERDDDVAVLFAHVSEPPPSLGARLPGLPGAADEVLARALAKAPDDRYGSCEDFADALREALGLAPYNPSGSAFAPDHPQTQIVMPHAEIATPPPGSGGLDAAGAGKAAVPADRAAAATIDSVPGGGSLATTDLPLAAAIVTDPAHPSAHREAVPAMTPAVTEEHIPAAAATAMTSSQPTQTLATVGESGRLTGEAGPPSADADGLASVAEDRTADQRPPSIPGSDGEIQPTRRPRRPLVIVLAGAVLAVAAIAASLVASSPSSPSSLSSRSSPTNGPLATLTDPHGQGVDSVAFSRSGTTLAAAAGNGSTYLWDVATGKLTATLADPDSLGVTAVAFSRSGTTLAAAAGNGSTYLWDVATGKLTATLADPDSLGVTAVAFSPSGTTLAAADGNGSTYLWDVASRSLTATLTDPNNHGASFEKYGWPVDSVAFSPNGMTLAAGGEYDTTDLWDVASRGLTASLSDPNGQGVSSVAFSPSGTTLAAVDGNGSIYLWNVASQGVTATLTGPGGQVAHSVAFSPSGTTLAAVDGYGSIYLWNVASQGVTATLTGPNGQGVSSVAFSPSGTTLAAGGSSGSTYLWHIS